jgi:hypothetical protein
MPVVCAAAGLQIRTEVTLFGVSPTDSSGRVGLTHRRTDFADPHYRPRPEAGGGPALVLYAAQGTKLVHLASSEVNSLVSFYPLALNDQDKEALNAAYPKK